MSDRPDELAEAAFPAPHMEADDYAYNRQRVRETCLTTVGDAWKTTNCRSWPATGHSAPDTKAW